MSDPHGGQVVRPERGTSREELDKRFPTFRLKAGVSSLNFADLGYATEAIKSYEIFVRLRNAGEIPENVRFR